MTRCHAPMPALRPQEIAQGLGLEYVFKASFDKANRTSPMSFRGPGLERGLQTLRAVREQAGVPVLTDVHESSQASRRETCRGIRRALPAAKASPTAVDRLSTRAQVARVAEVADVLQIPAFLCRQTDLITAAAATRKVDGRRSRAPRKPCAQSAPRVRHRTSASPAAQVVHIKKGQWCAAEVMVAAAEKARAAGNGHVAVCERGTQFGYDDLVVDPRNLVGVSMRR